MMGSSQWNVASFNTFNYVPEQSHPQSEYTGANLRTAPHLLNQNLYVNTETYNQHPMQMYHSGYGIPFHTGISTSSPFAQSIYQFPCGNDSLNGTNWIHYQNGSMENFYRPYWNNAGGNSYQTEDNRNLVYRPYSNNAGGNSYQTEDNRNVVYRPHWNNAGGNYYQTEENRSISYNTENGTSTNHHLKHSMTGQRENSQEYQCHLVNYLNYLHDESMPCNQMGQNYVKVPNQGHVNNSNVIVAANLKVLNVTMADQAPVNIDPAVEHDRGERSVFTEAMIVKPKSEVGCDNSEMYVRTSDDKSAKKLCCPFCEKLFTKLARHMETKHKQEPDVQKFLSFPKGSKARRLIQDSLRKIGLVNWGKNAELNKKELITSRRPNPKHYQGATGFKTCPYCFGQYSKKGLRLHVRYRCPAKPIVNDHKTKGERVLTVLATEVEARHHQNTSTALKKVYGKLRDDALSRIIKFDWLITLYGNKSVAKLKRRKSTDVIKNQLRLAGRFLRALKDINSEIVDLASSYKPKYFDNVIKAIQVVARLDEARDEYEAPATASSCVTVIKKIGAALINEYIRRDDREGQRITENFMTLVNSEIHTIINKQANQNRNKMKRTKGINLPLQDDVNKLAVYLRSESADYFNKLSTSALFEYDVWLQLSKLTMASIIVFNRKRVGDAENITVANFECKEEVNEETNEHLYASLSDESKEVAKRYSRMHVSGKWDRTVPVLLNSSMEKYISLLLCHREAAGISTKNEFLFALPSKIGDDRVINAGQTLSKFARLCGAKNPSSLIATNMRKQLATFCASIELNDTEVADVADFMGHAELVHRKVYRQNTIDRQVVKMAKVLEAAQGNSTYVEEKKAMVRKRKNAPSDSIVEKKRACLRNRKTKN